MVSVNFLEEQFRKNFPTIIRDNQTVTNILWQKNNYNTFNLRETKKRVI